MTDAEKASLWDEFIRTAFVSTGDDYDVYACVFLGDVSEYRAIPGFTARENTAVREDVMPRAVQADAITRALRASRDARMERPT
jgi:hypothetical protein